MHAGQCWNKIDAEGLASFCHQAEQQASRMAQKKTTCLTQDGRSPNFQILFVMYAGSFLSFCSYDSDDSETDNLFTL